MRSIEPTGTLAYVGADELIVYISPHSRTKTVKTRRTRKKTLADITFGVFPDTLDVQTSVLGSSRVLYIPVSQGSEITDLTLAFVAGIICGHCPEDALFRIVSKDSHAKHVCDLLGFMGHNCQLIPPSACKPTRGRRSGAT
jgi:hypothetical protein